MAAPQQCPQLGLQCLSDVSVHSVCVWRFRDLMISANRFSYAFATQLISFYNDVVFLSVLVVWYCCC